MFLAKMNQCYKYVIYTLLNGCEIFTPKVLLFKSITNIVENFAKIEKLTISIDTEEQQIKRKPALLYCGEHFAGSVDQTYFE